MTESPKMPELLPSDKLKYMRKIAMWLVWNVPLGSLAPHIFGFAIGCKKYQKVSTQNPASPGKAHP